MKKTDKIMILICKIMQTSSHQNKFKSLNYCLKKSFYIVVTFLPKMLYRLACLFLLCSEKVIVCKNQHLYLTNLSDDI